MGEDHRRGIGLEHPSHHLARVHAGAVDGTAKQLLVADHPVAGVEEETGEDLVRRAVETQLEIVAGALHVAERVLAADTAEQIATAEFEHRLELRVLGRTQPLAGAEAALVGGEQTGQPAVVGEQLARQVDRALAGHSGAQEDRQQLGVGEDLRAVRQQLLARALGARPVADRHRRRLPPGAARPRSAVALAPGDLR
ncbi:hypothetical protein MARPU_16065 [Marichromatium purpuratum 984]|uniref:Uncharacterized protein n=1 Tax=Marichromatium purpuratum 984 TaxID=765910 RepID=W0E487_MARPU|nr:hypothetical protein MARPU_16065 [Marichromatium purpuratum 984]